MLQLTGVDTSFLNMESPTTFGHVSSLSILDPGDDPDAGSYESIKRGLEERLHLLGPFRRRLVEVPFGLDRPYWVNDPDFDIDYHVRHIAVPPPGGPHEVADLVSAIAARRLDRTHPLWELYVIDGLENGRRAMMTKMHHAAVDGAAGVEILTAMLDLTPEGRKVDPPPEPWRPERIPSTPELMARTAVALATQPQKMARLQVRLARAMAQSMRNPVLAEAVRRPVGALPGAPRPSDPDPVPALPRAQAPRTSFNATITPHRRFAYRSVSLDDAKFVKKTFGTTVNDVVMAMCGAALRRYLDGRGELPDESLIAMVPVSLRTGDEADKFSNRVSGVFAPIHTEVADPAERLLAVSAGMKAAKEMHAAIPADILADFTQFAPPAMATRAIRLASRMRIADRMNPPFNVVISNVPGPPVPLYSAGARLESYIPVSTIGDGAGLNITVQSYCGHLDFGVISCKELVPDVWPIVDYLADALDELVEAAESSGAR